MVMKLKKTFYNKIYTIQLDEKGLDDCLTYTEWLDQAGKVIAWDLVDEDGEDVIDEVLISDVQNYVNNLQE
jgi:hypothetical protein